MIVLFLRTCTYYICDTPIIDEAFLMTFVHQSLQNFSSMQVYVQYSILSNQNNISKETIMLALTIQKSKLTRQNLLSSTFCLFHESDLDEVVDLMQAAKNFIKFHHFPSGNNGR